ncbi:MAG TPA: N-acetylmuramoyl-L-alanine amidase [Bacteroidales bacterium]|nr:N-acetylmuramoyl-L-alanine amidase [Bacteroidales bacterium]
MNKKYSNLNFPLVLTIFIIILFFSENADAQEAENGYKLRTVVIDAGHGGKDPGSLGEKTTEKEVVLAVALKVGKYIENNLPDVRVIYTRKTDEFIPLHQRAEIANTNKADLFISIHANGNTNSHVTGTESLVLGLHRAGENFEVAKKENSVILLEEDYSTKYEGFDPNSPESYIIFSLMQNLYFEQSINMAALVQDQFRDRAQRKDRGVKQQGLLVLARTSMPGILVETGFITNPDEEQYLNSEEGQDLIASAIFRAFRDYKNIIETKTSFTMGSRWENQYADNDTTNRHDTVSQTNTLPEEKETTAAVPPASPVVFKVQIAASLKPFAEGAREFKGMTNVSEYRVGNLYKYAVGNSPSFREILQYSKQVKEKISDAFIIAVKEGKIIPLDQALKESQLQTTNN